MENSDKLHIFYMNKHEEYVQKYGENVLILMLVGSFYEMYAFGDKGPNLMNISKLLNIVCTRKNKSEPESENNPKMMGFQMNSLEKFLEILTNNNYTVIVYNQKVALGKNFKTKMTREVDGIYTSSININNIQKFNNNFLMCIYLTNDEQKNAKSLKACGISYIDLSTGELYVFNSYSEKYDEHIAMDDVSRIINNISPSEILIYNDKKKGDTSTTENENYFYGYFNVDSNKCRYYENVDTKYKNISWQNEFMKKIYPESNSLLSPIEYLNLESSPYITVSICLLFDFIYDKMPLFLKNIKIPSFASTNERLILCNNAINQLDIFENKEAVNTKTKYKSLFHVINHTKTPLGERYLRHILTLPFVSEKKLNKIYDTTEQFCKLKLYKKLEPKLSEIRDIERYCRKMELQILKPFELCLFMSSYNSIVGILDIMKTDYKDYPIDKHLAKNIASMKEDIERVFNLDVLQNCFDTNFDHSNDIYKPKIYPKIDELKQKINAGKTTIEKLGEFLASLISKKVEKEDDDGVCMKNSKKDGNYLSVPKKYDKNVDDVLKNKVDEKKYTKKIVKNEIKITSNNKKIDELTKLETHLKKALDNINNDDLIEDEEEYDGLKIKNNSKDGYYLITSLPKLKILQDKIKTEKININGIDIKYDDFEFIQNKSNAKILIQKLNSTNNVKIENLEKELGIYYRHFYRSDLTDIYNKYNKLFESCNSFITDIDYLNSCATLSINNGYTKPIIKKKDNSYIDAKKIRHPIVEQIIDYEYVSHDVSIGNDLKGMLIYGLNSSGKSVLMKSIGLCLIMAQCGMFVPANSFEFSPYYKIMTRITGNDNIFKGLSSFGIEMSEINSIIKRGDKNTLVIGDEICRGTEYISGNALVASTILKLVKLESSFIFTTHLHDIMKLDRIKELPNVKAFHLKVSFDVKTNSLIYNRNLSEGCGEPVYGIMVAKYIVQDNEYIDIATDIKNELMNCHDSAISGKKSRYNKDMFVYECGVCGEKDNVKLTNLETHHINFQKDCDENDVVKDKKHLKKNSLANLVILCQTCHDKLHSNQISLNGYIQTSKGRKIV